MYVYNNFRGKVDLILNTMVDLNLGRETDLPVD